MSRRPSQNTDIHWSGPHLGVLVHIAKKVLVLHPELDDGSESRIDDLVNEAWLRGLRMRPESELHGCGSNLYHLMLTHLKRQKYGCSVHYISHAENCTYQDINDYWEAYDCAVMDTTVEDRRYVQELRHAIGHLLRVLRDQQKRDAVRLRFLKGWTYARIGKKMNVTGTYARRLTLDGIAVIKKACGVGS